MSETIFVRLLHPDGIATEHSLEIVQIIPGELKLSGIDQYIHRFSGADLFDAFINMRRMLEARNIVLLCQGSRKEVFPSGMSRNMGGGRKAYITKLGFPAVKTDMRDIFEPAEKSEIGTVDEQITFHAQWMSSIRK